MIIRHFFFDVLELKNLNKSISNINIKELIKFERKPRKFFLFAIFGKKIFFLLIIILVIFKSNLFQSKTKSDKSNASSFIYKFLSRNQNKKYDKLGKRIYSRTGSLSFNYLDKVFNKKKIDDSNSNFNHIHVAMSFNNDYHLLSSVSIASLLKNSAPTSFIHLHIIVVDGWVYSTMKKLNSLKYKINSNCEFIFHNGEQALKDFGEDSKKEAKGIGEYARLLAPYFANDTDRLIITDSADIFFDKDLLELYNYPLDDKFVKGIEDPYTSCFPTFIFFKKENYFNGGVLLVNAKKWREFDLYHDLVTFYKAFKYKNKLMTPIQDLLNNFFPSISVGNLPLRYNFQGYTDANGIDIYEMIYKKDCSKYYNKKKELIKEEKKIVIRHTNKFKTYYGDKFDNLFNEWTYYAKMTGFYKEICKKYPTVCK